MICRKNVFIMIAAILIFSSCMGAKSGARKSGASLYETFFVGSEGILYFIKPLSFVGTDNDELLADFTFRYKDQIKDSVVCNFSIISNEKRKMVDEVLLTANDMSLKCENIILLFNDKKGNQFISRFSGQLLFADFIKLFNTGNFNIEVDNKVYKMSSKTQQSVEKLKEKVFVLFD